MLISFAVTAKLICVFVFAYAQSRFSHDASGILFCLICLGGLSHDVILSIFHVSGEYGKIVSDRIIILYSLIIYQDKGPVKGVQSRTV